MEVVSGVHWIRGTAHCYLVVDKEITLIDTGLPRRTKKIVHYITRALHRKPTDIKTIFLTHADFDHTGSAEELRTLTGARIAAHPYDAEIISGEKVRPMPKGGVGIFFKLLRPLIKTRPFQVDFLVNEGDKVAGFQVIHMPGHTPGSIALYDPRKKVLFAGDSLRFRDGRIQGPSEGMTMDLNKAYESIEKLMSFNFDILLSGHSKPVLSNASTKVQEFLSKRKK